MNDSKYTRKMYQQTAKEKYILALLYTKYTDTQYLYQYFVFDYKSRSFIRNCLGKHYITVPVWIDKI